MPHDNHGSQSGDGSINVGVGDFRGANLNLNVGGNGKPTFSPEQIGVKRHPALGGRSVKSESLGTFGVVGVIISIAGLYFTVFPAFPEPKYSSWSTLFFFSLAIATMFFLVSVVLKRRKFEHFLFGKYYLEYGTKGGVYLNTFTAICPWCCSRMSLRNVGLRNGPRDDMFICERNPRQHRILLDPTVLSEIEEQ